MKNHNPSRVKGKEEKECNHNFVWNNRKHPKCLYCGYDQSQPEHKEEWSFIFDGKFVEDKPKKYYPFVHPKVAKEIKSFISSLLIQQRKADRKEVIKRIDKKMTAHDTVFGVIVGIEYRKWSELKKSLIR